MIFLKHYKLLSAGFSFQNKIKDWASGFDFDHGCFLFVSLRRFKISMRDYNLISQARRRRQQCQAVKFPAAVVGVSWRKMHVKTHKHIISVGEDGVTFFEENAHRRLQGIFWLVSFSGNAIVKPVLISCCQHQLLTK